ncbi:MAG: ACT domain-containing protein [Thermoplasmata archaeon]
MTLHEISLSLPNRPGTLAEVARLLAKERINLAAISVDSTPTRGRVRLVVSDPERAEGVLASRGYTVELREMIAVRLEDRAGSFLKVLESLARSKVNVQSVAILVARDGGQVLVAISSTDPARTRKLLRQARFVSQSAERLISNADLVAGSPTIPSETVGLLL